MNMFQQAACPAEMSSLQWENMVFKPGLRSKDYFGQHSLSSELHLIISLVVAPLVSPLLFYI